MRRTIRRSIGVTLALLSSWPLAAYADDTTDSNDLEGLLSETVVTGASRTAETSSDAPAVSTTISAKDMKRYGMRTVDEAINFLGLGMAIGSEWQIGQYSANGVQIQEDLNHHVLFLVDGVAQNEQFLGGMITGTMMGLPLDMIDHIEVILGPGSVLYGSQAMLGVVNIVTKSASDYKGVHATLDYGVSPPLNSHDDIIAPNSSNVGGTMRFDLSAGTTFKLFGKEAGLTIGAEYYDDNGPQTSYALQGVQPEISNAPQNFGPFAPTGSWGGTDTNTNYRHTLGGYMRINVGEVTSSFRLTTSKWAVPFMDFLYKPAFNDPSSYSTYTEGLADIRIEHAFSAKFTGMGRVYGAFSTFDRRDVEYTVTPNQSGECPQGPLGACTEHFGGNSAWVGAEAQGTMDWLGDDHQVTMAGADARLRNISGGDYWMNNATNLPLANYSYISKLQDALGLYAQHRAKFGEHLAANVGIRADFDTVNPNPSLFSGISPRIALVQSIDPTFNIKEVFSSAFRSPSAAELYLKTDVLHPALDNGITLKPEGVKQLSLIIDKRFGQQHFMVSGFYAEWTNMIEVQLINHGANLQFQNTASIQNYGANFSFDGAALDQRLRMALNFTVAKAINQVTPEGEKQQNETVAQAPDVYGNVRISYDLQNDKPVLALVASGMGPRLADNAFIGGYYSNLKPWPVAPPQVDLRATISGPVPSLKGVNYRIGGDYLFGKWTPNVIGPISGLPETPGSNYPAQAPALAPANRLTVFATVSMDVTP